MLENLTSPPPPLPTHIGCAIFSNYKALLFQQTANCLLKYINRLRLTRVTFIGLRTNKGVPLTEREFGLKSSGQEAPNTATKHKAPYRWETCYFERNDFCFKDLVWKALFSDERLNCKCCGTFICSKICLQRKKVPSLR